MTHSQTTRRLVALGLPLLSGAVQAGIQTSSRSPLAAIERRHGGRLGVFALDTGSGRTLQHRPDERFLMCSTFKALLAAQTLARVDAGYESLARVIPYTKQDLLFTSPVTEARVAQGGMTVDELCRAMLEFSDNTASVLLMRSAGGPAALTRFIRACGDEVTRSDRFEPEANRLDGRLDTTSPRAMAKTLTTLLLGKTLQPASRQRLEDGMAACRPGLQRLRAVLPAGWAAGDRPGTSVDRASNDCAIVRPPGRAPLLVAMYYDAPRVAMPDRERVLREAGRVFVQWASSAAVGSSN